MSVHRELIEQALARAGVSAPLADVRNLAGGTFNAVHRLLLADGTRLVLKASPPPGVTIMRYERGILGTEALYYRLAAGRAPLPAVVHAEPGLLIMSELPGATLSGQPGRAPAGLRYELGGHLAALHTITGTGFGYPAGPLRDTWPAAFADMVGALLDDAADFGLDLPRPAERIRELFAARAGALGAVTEPRLVHFDLWDGNILTSGGRVTGLIDAERAFWGDPVADLVSTALFGEIADDADLLAGYRAAGGTFGEAEAGRLRVYQAYLYLIMWIETAPRGYPPDQVAARRATVGPLLDRIFAGWDAAGRVSGHSGIYC